MTNVQYALVKGALDVLCEAYIEEEEAPLNTGDLYGLIEIAVKKLESALELPSEGKQDS